MGLLLDASVLIEHERGRLQLDSHLAEHPDRAVLLSTITASELLHGVHRADTVARKTRRSAWVEAILERFPMLSLDLATARAHARLGADLASRGQSIGPHDLWLAASCLAHAHTLATANVREFLRIDGLEVEDWRE